MTAAPDFHSHKLNLVYLPTIFTHSFILSFVIVVPDGHKKWMMVEYYGEEMI